MKNYADYEKKDVESVRMQVVLILWAEQVP